MSLAQSLALLRAAENAEGIHIALSRIGEIKILLKQPTLRVAEKRFNCAGGAGVWPEFGSLRILVIIIFAFLCALCASSDPANSGRTGVR